MNNYLNVQPGKVVKKEYLVTETRVAEAEQPIMDGQFSVPYTAKISLELGNEKIDVYANNGKFSSDVVRYKNSTKAQRIMTLGKVVGKIVSGEMKAIFGKSQSPINYKGMPAKAIDAVEKARKSYNTAYEEYLRNLAVPKSEEKLVSTRTENITPRNAPAGFLDDLL